MYNIKYFNVMALTTETIKADAEVFESVVRMLEAKGMKIKQVSKI